MPVNGFSDFAKVHALTVHVCGRLLSNGDNNKCLRLQMKGSDMLRVCVCVCVCVCAVIICVGEESVKSLDFWSLVCESIYCGVLGKLGELLLYFLFLFK